jgi:aspartate/methionine/tyrosine aminotransferase
MKIVPFETEHFYARYEFTTPYQLCNSDCETVSVAELLYMADIPLSALGNLPLGYTESQGDPKLREMIAESYATTRPDEVIILGTPIEGIYLMARAGLDPGDEVIVSSPAYDALINMFAHVVGPENVQKWQFKGDGNYWELDLSELESMLTTRTRMLVVNFPHNPTGYLPTQDMFSTLIEIVNRNQLILFCDEMYYGLVHSGTFSIPSAADLTDQGVVLSGLSKTYGLPGLRTGWLVVRDRSLRENLLNWKFYTSICPPAPSEFLAKVAWKVREELRTRNITRIEDNLRLADAFFTRWPELFTWRRPVAGSTALVGMNVPSVAAFSEQLAEEAGILIHPGGTLGGDDQHMRMGFGRDGFGTALGKFEEYLNNQKVRLDRRTY